MKNTIVPLMKDADSGVHDSAISQYYRRSEGEEYMGYSIRTMSHRLVEWRNFDTGEVTAGELHDHQDQHSESKNIIDLASPDLVDKDKIIELSLKTHPRKIWL